MEDSDSVEELWERFKTTGDRADRDSLMLHYAKLVRDVAGRVRAGLPSSVDLSDLISDGTIGLIDAIDKFDPDRGIQFQTYAATRIRGAIVDGLRSTDWVPRSVRERLRDVGAVKATLEMRLGHPPDDHQVAEELSITLNELRAIYAHTTRSTVLSFDADAGDAETLISTVDMPGSDDDIPPGFLAAVRELAERDQVVIALYYWDRFTLAEIGQVLGVTESRVSQLHSRATMTLRRKLLDAAV